MLHCIFTDKTTWVSFSVGIGTGFFLIVYICVFVYERHRRNKALLQDRLDRLGPAAKVLKKGKPAHGKDIKKEKENKKKVAWHK